MVVKVGIIVRDVSVEHFSRRVEDMLADMFDLSYLREKSGDS